MMADRETDNSNSVERTAIKLISTNKTIRLNDAIMIAGFPGPGLVGSMSVSYIIEQQKMHQIGYIDSDFIVPGVIYIGGKLRHPFRIYANDEGTACVLVCDAPVILSGIRSVLNTVVIWARYNGVREIMVLEGMAAPRISETGRRPWVLSNDGQSDDHGYLSRIKDKKPKASPPAVISGVSGGLLAACLSNRIPCTALLIPSITGIPDPEGAAILIEKTNELANNPFRIDVRQLRSEAEALKRQLQELINSVKRQQQDQQKTQPGTGTGMYS
ncbi:MAG: PAC2 family protein [Thermoproteota archaeon]|nr:PAC2 family protein [Thermoproteota archaeon]